MQHEKPTKQITTGNISEGIEHIDTRYKLPVKFHADGENIVFTTAQGQTYSLPLDEQAISVIFSKFAIPKQKETEDDTRKNLKNMTCPQCRKNFVLTYDDYTSKPATLILRGCPSGGIYDVRISCPHCDYEEEL